MTTISDLLNDALVDAMQWSFENVDATEQEKDDKKQLLLDECMDNIKERIVG